MMNRKLLRSLICINLFALNSNAQIKFQKTIGGAILDWANAIEQTPDSNFIVLGSTKNFGSGMEDIYLIKINTLGDTLWTRTFGDSTDDEEGGFVKPTNDGGFIIAGTTNSFGAGNGDIYLVKTDGNGNHQWSKTYGGPNLDFCHGLQQCADEGFIISGYSNSFGAGGSDVYLIKTDIAGTVQWSRTIGNNGHDEGFSAIQTNDGGFAVTGSTFISGSNDAVLTKTDSSGNVTWTKSYGGSMHDVGYSLIQTSDGGYCIAGSTASFGVGDTDIYLLRTDANGDTLWSKTYGSSSTETCFALHQNNDDGFVLTGHTSSFGIGGFDMLIIRTDEQGQELWTRTIGGFSNARDEGRAVTQTFDGGYIVAGYTQSFGGGGGTDIFIVKTDSLGESGCNHVTLSITEQPITSAVATTALAIDSGATENSASTIQGYGAGVVNIACANVGINEQAHSDNQILVYPNPVSNVATVTITVKEITNEVSYNLYDVQGREVKHLLINTLKATINQQLSFILERDNLLPGMYFYHVRSDGNIIGVGKVVIE